MHKTTINNLEMIQIICKSNTICFFDFVNFHKVAWGTKKVQRIRFELVKDKIAANFENDFKRKIMNIAVNII